MKHFCKWVLCFLFLFFYPTAETHAVPKKAPLHLKKQEVKKPSKQNSASPAVSKKANNQKSGTAKKTYKNYDQMSAKSRVGADEVARERTVSSPPTYSENGYGLKFWKMFGTILFAVPFLLVGLLMLFSCWRIFVKAGREGWESLIPLLNLFRFIQIAKMPMWSIVLAFIPGLQFVFPLWFGYALAKSFDKSMLYALGIIFLPMIFYPHLAYSDASYISEYETPGRPTNFSNAA